MIKLNYPYIIRIIFIFVNISKCFFFIQNNNNDQLIKESKYFSIPFKENIPYYYKAPSNYSSSNFIYDYFLNNLFIDLNIGTPTKKISSFINQESFCFKFVDTAKKNKSNIINYNNNNKEYNKYCPKQSLTFLLNKNNRAFIAEDYFLFERESNNNISSGVNMPFIIETDFGEIYEELELTSEIGLNEKFNIDNNANPNFLKELKKKKLIKDEIYSFIYKTDSKGYFIFGDNLFNIYGEKYKKINFFKNNVIQNINGIKWNINFDKIYIHDKFLEGNKTLSNKANEGKVYLPCQSVNLKINQNIIIGTMEYKNMIDNLIFNKFIQSNICKIEEVEYNLNTYYVYSCTALLFATFDSPFDDDEDDYYQEPIYHYLHFPSLIFYSDSLKYSFEINYLDLFQLIGGRFYFMIVFNANSKDKNENTQGWVIGKQFLRKNIFTYNIKDKRIEFYNEKNFNEHFDTDFIVQDGYDSSSSKDTTSNYNYKYTLIIVIAVVICFSIFSFILGIKIKERRKKRANELEDQYEYYSERETNNESINNVSINEKIKDEKDVYINSDQNIN